MTTTTDVCAANEIYYEAMALACEGKFDDALDLLERLKAMKTFYLYHPEEEICFKRMFDMERFKALLK